jgi:hypothetical protein
LTMEHCQGTQSVPTVAMGSNELLKKISKVARLEGLLGARSNDDTLYSFLENI